MKDDEQRPIAQNVLAFVLDETLRLLHPFVPFISESIYQKLNETAPERGLAGLCEIEFCDALVVARWPNRLDNLVNEEAESKIVFLQEAIRAIRDVKSKYNKPLREKVCVSIKADGGIAETLSQNSSLVEQLAGAEQLSAGASTIKPANAAVSVLSDASEIYVHDMIDPEAERKRLEKQKQDIEKARRAVESKLSNENFVNKARPEVVERAREKMTDLSEQLRTVQKHLSQLK